MRPIIYQLFVRHFSNTTTTGITWGDKSQNGCGTFAGINDAALESLAKMGVTHLWLTGILRHATQSSYPTLPASPACVTKGKAGSPYAVSDYYDVDPDLALNPDHRLQEFQALLKRVHHWGMVPLMDFIPNHVSRDYHTSLPDTHVLGEYDRKQNFFNRDNAFYYLEPWTGGPDLNLPEGPFPPEHAQARVTGNNAATWSPSPHDWYETVKLNYGVDYRHGAAAADSLPSMLTDPSLVPLTWRAMDDILAYWQAMGIGGFRCDMAHMIPMPFWRWAIARCRLRDSYCLMMAEAYNDHMKMSQGDVQEALLQAGFDAVYDAKSYEYLRQIYEGGRWANDLDDCHRKMHPQFRGGVRYLENHDEPRVCSEQYWGGLGEKVMPALMIAQYASSCGPVLFYNGQEFGERAEGPSGYGGDNGRTSIFDYTCLPRMQAWVNGGKFDDEKLSPEQIERRAWISKLLCILQHPALSDGEFYGLNWGNKESVQFGRAPGVATSGHFSYAFLRHHRKTKSTLLAACNFSARLDREPMRITIPYDAQQWAGKTGGTHVFKSVLIDEIELRCTSQQLAEEGICFNLPTGQARLLLWEVE